VFYDCFLARRLDRSSWSEQKSYGCVNCFVQTSALFFSPALNQFPSHFFLLFVNRPHRHDRRVQRTIPRASERRTLATRCRRMLFLGLSLTHMSTEPPQLIMRNMSEASRLQMNTHNTIIQLLRTLQPSCELSRHLLTCRSVLPGSGKKPIDCSPKG